MAEITSAAYQDIRDYIKNNWKYIELKSNTGAKIGRYLIDGTKVKWIHSAGARTMEIQGALSGNDFTLPVTIARVQVFKTSTDTSILADETFESVTLEYFDDRINVNLRIEVPSLT